MCPWYFALLHLVDGIYTSGKITRFWGHLLAVWLKCIIVWRVSCPDLFLDNLPPKCVPGTLLYYIWLMAYTQEERLHDFVAILAVYHIRLVSKCEFCADLFLDNLPPKCVPPSWIKSTRTIRQPSAKRRVKHKHQDFHGQIIAIYHIWSASR